MKMINVVSTEGNIITLRNYDEFVIESDGIGRMKHDRTAWMNFRIDYNCGLEFSRCIKNSHKYDIMKITNKDKRILYERKDKKVYISKEDICDILEISSLDDLVIIGHKSLI